MASAGTYKGNLHSESSDLQLLRNLVQSRDTQIVVYMTNGIVQKGGHILFRVQTLALFAATA